MYKEIQYESVQHLKDQSILIVTATDLETTILHSYIGRISEGKILKCHIENNTYYIGIFGAYTCFHVQCGTMGSIGNASSIITVRDSIKLLSPKITLMIGIAFGVDPIEQTIGDVIVAETIVPYDYKKITPEQTTIRATPVPTSKLLRNRFQNIRGWQHQLKERLARKIISPVFSGEELINNLDRRKELEKLNPLAKGGEMEGAGLYAASNGETEWILIKGICDFADGNKDENKDENQKIAMHSAISLCLEVFSSLNSFEHIHLFPHKPQTVKLCGKEIDKKKAYKVLFDLYDEEKEKYYLSRDIDNGINNQLEYFSLWVSGTSGRGKSISVTRNLIQSKNQFISIFLTGCINLTVDDFFHEIYVELLFNLETNTSVPEKTSYGQTIRLINQLLSKHFHEKPIYILIDEIPLGNDDNFKDFSERIFSLFISSNLNNSSANVKYILSSIHSPEKYIRDFHMKIREYVKFVEYKDWSSTECLQLISIIEKELSINLDEEIKNLIIEEAKGSPRWIKRMFKNAVVLGKLTPENIANAITETKNEKVA